MAFWVKRNSYSFNVPYNMILEWISSIICVKGVNLVAFETCCGSYQPHTCTISHLLQGFKRQNWFPFQSVKKDEVMLFYFKSIKIRTGHNWPIYDVVSLMMIIFSFLYISLQKYFPIKYCV